ncbi:MAG: tRNA guanosine(34) transglycosylase Tgt [Thermoplasmatota archaeon]
MTFELISGGSTGPRSGILALPSGIQVRTPFFMPVATKLSVKTLESGELGKTGTKVVITNGFLSHLEPGSESIRIQGGMHHLMNWNGGIFSDSGGFQFIRKGFDPRITDEGVLMRSPYSGAKVIVTPESVVDFHVMHGVDVGMVLDHCPPYPSNSDVLASSARRTVEWARRSMERIRTGGIEELSPFDDGRLPLLYAITQGGTDMELRRKNTEELVSLDFPGYGIGGLSIGEDKDLTFKALKASTEFLPEDRPRYFMGVGQPEDIIRSVANGVDVFDSVFPTRNARHRSVFTIDGRENIRASRWKGLNAPISTGCRCHTCGNYSRGYIYHLFKGGEPLGPRLATIHNLHFIQDLVVRIRRSVLEGEFDADMSVSDLWSD